MLKDGDNSVRIDENLNIFKDHDIKICCRGEWQSGSDEEVCKTTILKKLCD